MREIKFRAWDNGEMQVVGFNNLSENRHHPSGHIHIREEMKPFGKSHITNLMQFTGLKDKNGREIYEGDLIKFKVLYERIGKVIISPTRLELFDGNEYWDVYEDEDLEIVGNIYENPELLAGDSK